VTVTCHEVGRRLDAYVDHELDGAESARFEGHVVSCAACRRRVSQRESLERLFRRVPYYSMPDRLRTTITTMQVPRSRLGLRLFPLAAAAILAVSLGSVPAVRMLRARQATDVTAAIAEGIVDSHIRALMADHLFDVRSTDRHTVKPWFLGRLDFSPPVEDLAPAGFPLVGGRLEYIADRSAAALVYERRQHTINLVIWPQSTSTAADDVRSIRGFQLRHWSRDGMSFWAVSDLNEAELADFEHALQAPSPDGSASSISQSR
jgi:anti-sigma factor RsiW